MQVTELQSAERTSTARAGGIKRLRFPASSDSQGVLWLPGRIVRDLATATPLIAADLASVLIALAVACQLATWLWPAGAFDGRALCAAFAAAICVANLGVGLYPGTGLTLIAEARLASVVAVYIGPIFVTVSLWQNPLTLPLQFIIAATCLLLGFMLPFSRALFRAAIARVPWWQQPALVVGDGNSADAVYWYLRRNLRLGLRPVGIIGDLGSVNSDTDGRILGLMSRASGLWKEWNNPWVIIAMPRHPPDEVRRTIHFLSRHPVPRIVVSRVDASPSLWRRATRCLDWPGKRGRYAPMGGAKALKRAIDLVLTVVGGLLAFPLVVVIAAAVRCESRGPAFYLQERVGRNGRRFLVWKFRTMVCDGDRALRDYLAAHPDQLELWNRDHKLENDPRITRIGRWLRKTSLDELPQLWNVLRGEMSLVGPRPILASEIANFGSSFEAFCSVLPGITGLWQVSGRNSTTYAEHVELDAYYVRNWSLWLDLLILALTFKVVLSREGAY